MVKLRFGLTGSKLKRLEKQQIKKNKKQKHLPVIFQQFGVFTWQVPYGKDNWKTWKLILLSNSSFSNAEVLYIL